MGVLIQLLLENAWYCRLLARGFNGEAIAAEQMERMGEDVCGTPPTSSNKLPPCADPEKSKILNTIQLAPISLLVGKEKIKMVRTSSTIARDSWSLKEIPDTTTPLNEWRCESSSLRSLVSTDCQMFASAHAAYYYRNHIRVYLGKSYL